METRCPRPSCSRVTPLFECFRHQGIWWISRDFKGSMAVLSKSWRLGSRLVSWLPLTPYGQPRLKSVMDSMAADGEAAPIESMASTWSKIQRYPKFTVCSHIFPQTKYDEMNIWKPLSSILASWTNLGEHRCQEMEGMVAPNPMTADELKVGHQPSRALLMQPVVDVIPLWCVIGMFQSWLTIHQNHIVPCWLLKWNVTTQNHMQQSKAHSLVVPFGRFGDLCHQALPGRRSSPAFLTGGRPRCVASL